MPGKKRKRPSVPAPPPAHTIQIWYWWPSDKGGLHPNEIEYRKLINVGVQAVYPGSEVAIDRVRGYEKVTEKRKVRNSYGRITEVVRPKFEPDEKAKYTVMVKGKLQEVVPKKPVLKPKALPPIVFDGEEGTPDALKIGEIVASIVPPEVPQEED